MSLRRGITAREPVTPDAAGLGNAGIVRQSDDLFTGRWAPRAQAPVHFGLARITAESLPFWRRYRLSAGRVADLLTRLANRLAGPEHRLDLEALAREYGWSAAEMAAVAEAVRRRGEGAKRVFRSVKGGVTGFEWVLDEDFASTEDRFVAYAAREPLVDRPAALDEAVAAEPAACIRDHRERYGDLLLTVGVATERGLPTVTHFGIFRNPLAFLDATPEYRGLAMRLHGFAALVCGRVLSGKAYMITNPMPRMGEIFRRSLSPEELYAGEDEGDLRAYLNRNLPPGITRLRADQRLGFAGYTRGARPTVVKLEALARCYRPATAGSDRTYRTLHQDNHGNAR